MRQAPSIDIAMRLRELGAEAVAHDPVVMDNARPHFEGVILAPDVESAVTGADAIAIITEWPEYRALDWPSLRGLVRRPVVVDGRNCLDAATPIATTSNAEAMSPESSMSGLSQRPVDTASRTAPRIVSNSSGVSCA
jgi:UDP-N-acetyl-D-mannosaminuronate dehydrogenase